MTQRFDVNFSFGNNHHEEILMRLSELQAQLAAGFDSANAQLAKVKTEILAKLDELTQLALDPEVDPTALAVKADEVKAAIQAIDDIVPDAPPVS